MQYFVIDCWFHCLKLTFDNDECYSFRQYKMWYQKNIKIAVLTIFKYMAKFSQVYHGCLMIKFLIVLTAAVNC